MNKIKTIFKSFFYLFLAALFIADIALILSALHTDIERIVGFYVLRIPYGDFVIKYARTYIGLAILIAVPCIILLNYILIFVADMVHNRSKHRKKIMRKRMRRNKRYMNEGLYKGKKAVI